MIESNKFGNSIGDLEIELFSSDESEFDDVENNDNGSNNDANLLTILIILILILIHTDEITFQRLNEITSEQFIILYSSLKMKTLCNN